MDAKETREKLTAVLATVLMEGSLLGENVAAEVAEKQMTVLLEQEYLITNNQVYSVIETSGKGSGDDEYDAWDVYTHAEPWDDEDEEMAEEERQAKRDADDAGLASAAGVDEDGVHYE